MITTFPASTKFIKENTELLQASTKTGLQIIIMMTL
jgi:hypothetical protein